MEKLLRGTAELVKALHYTEPPLGLFYTARQPADGFHPEAGPLLSRTAEAAGALDFQSMRANFSCILGKIRLTRKKGKPAWFSATNYGCTGGAFFSGFCNPHLEAPVFFVSTGRPGSGQRGERYLPDPATVRRFLAATDMGPAPEPYLVVKPLAAFQEGEKPLLALFFARPEQLSGLCSLAWFTAGEADAVDIPFGSGCASLISWPLKGLAEGRPKAVLGGMDLSCRKYLDVDELSLALPFDLYAAMLERLSESALTDETWALVRKKADRSGQRWSGR